MSGLSRGWFLITLMIVAVLAGCGYRPMGADSRPDQERLTLAIPPFANRSTEVGLETTMANAFIQTFGQNKALRLVTRPEEADLVLEGKVQAVENSSVAFFDVTRSLVRRVTIYVDLTLKRRESGRVVWKESSHFFEDYVVQPNYHVGEATKAMGIRRGAATLARRALDKVLLAM